jgi:hypothetical protein
MDPTYERIKKMKTASDTAGAAIAYAMGAGIFGIMVISSFSSFATPQLMFTLFSSSQLLLTVLLLRYEFPQTFYKTLMNFQIFKLDFSFLYPILGDKIVSKRFKEAIDQNNPKLATLGYESGSMIDNYCYFFISLGVMFLLHLIHNLFYPCLC